MRSATLDVYKIAFFEFDKETLILLPYFGCRRLIAGHYLIIVSAINMDVINTSLCLTKYSGHIFGLNYGHESVEFIYK